MAIYRSIQMSFWTDPKVIDAFAPEDKYFYLYLMTNPHTNLCGCYEISERQIEYETGYTKKTIEKLLERMCEVHRVIVYSKDTKEVLIVNWHKYNWTKSEKFRVPLEKEIQNVKNVDFKAFLEGLFNGINTVSIPYKYGSDTTVTVTDTVTVSNTNNKRFVKPTVDEVREYCIEKGYTIDPQRFVDYYESNGWMIGGKSHVKDWKAAVRTWQSRQKDHQGASQPSRNKFSSGTERARDKSFYEELEAESELRIVK